VVSTDNLLFDRTPTALSLGGLFYITLSLNLSASARRLGQDRHTHLRMLLWKLPDSGRQGTPIYVVTVKTRNSGRQGTLIYVLTIDT